MSKISKIFDKTPYTIQPKCVSCILEVAYKFLNQGLKIEENEKKVAVIEDKLNLPGPKNENELKNTLVEQKNLLKEKKDKEWKGVKILIKDMEENLSKDSYAVILASKIFNKVKELTGNPDPWRDLKAMSNLICLNVDYDVREYIFSIEDEKERLRTALIFSALANTIDFGTAMHQVDLRFSYKYLMNQLEIFEKNGFAIDNFEEFYKSLLVICDDTDSSDEEDEEIDEDGEVEEVDFDDIGEIDEDEEDDDDEYEELRIDEAENTPIADYNGELDKLMAESLVILLDNSGEIVFDKILIEVLQKMGVSVIAVVKGGPISNDATIEDAIEIDLVSTCPVISTGSADLGFNPNNASKEFLELITTAPIILAKGQANFESINTFRESILNPEIYLLAKFKCDVNAKNAGVDVNDYVIWKMQ